MPQSVASMPLIVGAGPVGKAAALFLARAGRSARLIDASPEPSPYSKALAVNPRTLELLEPTGVTERMLALGSRIYGAKIWSGDKCVGEIMFDVLEHRFPFMLALSQAVTERLLDEALQQQGGTVERGIKLVGCRNLEDAVEAELTEAADDSNETVMCPWLLAADGAHSTARHALNIGFSGSNFDTPWHLADVPLSTPLEQDRVHVFISHERGFVFAVRVVENVAEETQGDQLWRVISNLPNPLERLHRAAQAGPPVWSSSFQIAHRIVDSMQVGNVYFAGDAAHIHSPVGARGMNLGIEDAWVFSELVKNGDMRRYDALRRNVDYRVVKRVETISRVARGESVVARLVRGVAVRALINTRVARRQMIRTVTGLDHSVQPVAS